MPRDRRFKVTRRRKSEREVLAGDTDDLREYVQDTLEVYPDSAPSDDQRLPAIRAKNEAYHDLVQFNNDLHKYTVKLVRGDIDQEFLDEANRLKREYHIAVRAQAKASRRYHRGES